MLMATISLPLEADGIRMEKPSVVAPNFARDDLKPLSKINRVHDVDCL